MLVPRHRAGVSGMAVRGLAWAETVLSGARIHGRGGEDRIHTGMGRTYTEEETLSVKDTC